MREWDHTRPRVGYVDPQPTWAATVRWWWQRQRARHQVWAADVAYRRKPTPAAGAAWARAVAACHRVETGRP